MKKTLLAIMILVAIAGCTTIENHYTVLGDSNRLDCPSTAAPVKVIDTGLSAAASQGGSAGSESSK